MINDCPFCKLDKERIIFENIYSYSLLDIYPVTKGHTLVIPKRHLLSIDEINQEEFINIFETVIKVKRGLIKFLNPDGFNFGINLGETSGQTIEHIHFHLIPRYKNDTMFIDGGIRKVTMDFTNINTLDLKSKWINNRLSNEEIRKLAEIINIEKNY